MEQPSNASRILLVEDDINLGYLLVENLKSKGFEVLLCTDGKAATEVVNTQQFDLCIFDIMLPGSDGFSLSEVLRKKKTGTPFVFLTARVQEQDKLHGFELGADDYITKPFSMKELYYRILVALRRKSAVANIPDKPILIGGIELHPSERLLMVNGTAKKLSQRETGLIKILAEQKNKYVTRSEILRTVWGVDDYFASKSLEVYVTRIRKILKDCCGVEIENLYGTGYRIRENNLNSHSQ